MWKGIHAAVEVGVLRLSMDDGWTSKFNEMGRICGLNRDGDRGGLHRWPVYHLSPGPIGIRNLYLCIIEITECASL